jgi:hypothetical protein
MNANVRKLDTLLIRERNTAFIQFAARQTVSASIKGSLVIG